MQDALTYFGLPEFLQIQLEWLHVFLKAQSAHGTQQIVPVDSLPLLFQAFVTSPEGMHMACSFTVCRG